jgi:hypothetical protein
MKRLKYYILKKLTGSLGLGVLSIAFTKRLARLVSRPISINIESSFSSNKTMMTELDTVIISRLTEFWNSSQESQTSAEVENSPWNAIQSRQTQLHKLMAAGDSEKIYSYLISSPTQSICNGVLQGDSETKMLRINRSYRNLQSRITVNRFVSLLEGIGRGFLVQNPEQGGWGVKKGFPFNEALERLDQEFGFIVRAPIIYDGLLQTTIGDRNFNQVDIMALNASLQIKNVLKNSANESILEIGAGSGTTAYWCNRLGLGPIQIIDLPHVALLQAFYLLKVLPNVNILLYGEEQGASEPDITIYPHWAFLELPKNKVELVFNQDSFAEMSNETVLDYLTWISDVGAQFLLSINHESGATYDSALASQANISKLIQENSTYLRLSRHPNWIRQGYIDQVWKIN